MEHFDLLAFFQSIDWVFAVILLIGGWQWGKYFTFTKNGAWNFLIFSTLIGGIYLLILHIAYGIQKEEFTSIFVTYLFTTSFYELLGKALLSGIENAVSKWLNKQSNGN